MIDTSRPAINASEFDNYGFGVEAIKAIAESLNKDIGNCGFCNPDETGEPCDETHFYPYAESALRALDALRSQKYLKACAEELKL